jgi:tetratricopeptide (TPR) repeat protein
MQAFFCPRWAVVFALVLSWPPIFAQRTGSRSGGSPNRPSTSFPGADASTTRPLYVSGTVLLEGGIRPTEPIEIQRICSGLPRREGFSNSKGEFQFQLGSTMLQDASESIDAGGATPQRTRSNQPSQYQYQGCELRAALPGFQSTSVPLRIEDDFGEVNVGTIVLSRMGNVEGATISLTSLTAPKEAREAYERARKAEAQKKLGEAEKELNKAVELYPRYAAAWDLLGTIHEDHPDLAIKEFSQSIACDSQFVNPYFGMALIALKQRKWAEVQSFTEQVLRLNAFAFPIAHLYNGAANYYLGRMDAAEQSARRFQSIDKEHRRPDVSLLLADILEAKKDYAGAARQLRDYLTLVPSSPHAGEITADVQRLEGLGTSPQE